MTGGVCVSGGLDSVRARPDAMRTAGSVLRRVCGELDEVVATCSAGYWGLWTMASLGPVADTALLQPAQDALSRSQRAIDAAAVGLRTVAARLDRAALLYEAVDHLDLGVLHEVAARLGALWHASAPARQGLQKLPDALATGTATALATGSPGAGGNAFGSADPQLLDTLLDGAALDLLANPLWLGAVLGTDAFLQQHYADGEAVVTPAGTDTAVPAGLAPRDLTDLIAGVAWRDAHQDETDGTAGGEIDVKFLHHPDGTRSVVVDIPGTKDWAGPGRDPDVTGWASNIRAIQGVPTSYAKGVLDAMQRAGVRPDDHVMLVGHSLGGMVAVQAARAGVRSGRFAVTDVVTAGSPIGNTVGAVPPSVRVLALENRADAVPELDARANPVRRNVLTATADEPEPGGLGGNHHLDDAYRAVADAVQHSGDPAIDYYLAGAEEYLDADSVRTQRYVITRSYR